MKKSIKKLTIIKPDDFHVHLRDRDILSFIAPQSARHFGRILVMPNLNPPVVTIKQALSYRRRILNAIKKGGSRASKCQPLMTLYLTEYMSRDVVREVAETEAVIGFKLYPAHATTQSQFGVSEITKVFPLLEEMERQGVYLMIHGEDISVDIFDREKIFVDKTLAQIIKKFPALKITLEHITTREAVDFIKSAPPQVRAGVTPHHLLLSRNDLLSGGLNPHHYCMPIVKRDTHRDYLLKVVLSGNDKFFLGSDSAPHWEKNKLTACGCAGIYSAPVIIPLLAELFEKYEALHLLENFTSVFGSRHYGLEPNRETITLIKKSFKVPRNYNFVKKTRSGSSNYRLIPFRNGSTLSWKVEG